MGYLLLGISITGVIIFGFLLLTSSSRFFDQKRKKLSEIEEDLWLLKGLL